ncbi:MAG: 2-dehydro-3-deoxyglucarate aldolase [Firmicutes bacterium]|nr:2-dehydro-3-deoxyglucarate aldolase [Bacillota bacterium]
MKNPVKAMMQEKAAIGTFLTLGSPAVSEMLADVGYDFVIIDTEHGPLSVESAMAHMQALGKGPCVPFIRVAWNDVALIKRALDIGAYGVVVPMVNTAEEARRAVSYSKYHPLGMRGFGAARATTYGRDMKSYLDKANEEVLLFVQVEDIRAVENVGEIVSVPGLDGIFIGPGDLAASMGRMGNWQHPEVKQAIDKAIKAGLDAGLFVGIWADTPAAAKERIEQGCRFVAVSLDTIMFIQASSAILRELGR